jgi:hypothetical protein
VKVGQGAKVGTVQEGFLSMLNIELQNEKINNLYEDINKIISFSEDMYVLKSENQ